MNMKRQTFTPVIIARLAFCAASALLALPAIAQNSAQTSAQASEDAIGPTQPIAVPLGPVPTDSGATVRTNSPAAGSSTGLSTAIKSKPEVGTQVVPRLAGVPIPPNARRGVLESAPMGLPDADRVVFNRVPVRITLPVNAERLIGLPAVMAVHVPEAFEALVQTQIIDRTLYIKALAEFAAIRVVAEELSTGRQIPIDFVAVKGRAMNPVEIVVPGMAQSGMNTANRASGQLGHSTHAASSGVHQQPQDPHHNQQHEQPPVELDMVALTRYAAQSLYAPARLSPSQPGVTTQTISAKPIKHLYRGYGIATTPIAAWRSGNLYVTAVRFTNQSPIAQTLDLQELRGSWLAATAQHTRLLGSASADSETTVYLVCDKPFDLCQGQ
jgi:integrating conjugative element protein (TIGR03749 family)